MTAKQVEKRIRIYLADLLRIWTVGARPGVYTSTEEVPDTVSNWVFIEITEINTEVEKTLINEHKLFTSFTVVLTMGAASRSDMLDLSWDILTFLGEVASNRGPVIKRVTSNKNPDYDPTLPRHPTSNPVWFKHTPIDIDDYTTVFDSTKYDITTAETISGYDFNVQPPHQYFEDILIFNSAAENEVYRYLREGDGATIALTTDYVKSIIAETGDSTFHKLHTFTNEQEIQNINVVYTFIDEDDPGTEIRNQISFVVEDRSGA